MNISHKNIIAVTIIIVIGILFQKNYINEFPSHIHAWAQSDRYAIALRFTDNNLNFFKPETFVFNHQFPHDMKIPAEETITAVDFPIHDFIPAIFMKLSNTKSPWIFRLYVLIYSFIGLFFLFRLAIFLTTDFLKSILITILAATSPVFVYYQSGFLPTIPSLSNAFIGIYFYALYLQSNKIKQFNLALLFITIAALSRTTFAIPLIALLGYEFIRLLIHRTDIKPKIIPVFLSVSSLLFFFFYNAYLREKYGSVFLNHLMPASSFERVIEILRTVKEKWGLHYFSTIHYVVFVLLFGLLFIFYKRVKITHISRELLYFTLIIIIGCLLFTILMIRQFSAHDYYFLDTYFLPVILVFTIILSALPSTKSNLKIGTTSSIIIFIGILLINYSLKTQKSRRISSSEDKTMATIKNFDGADTYLDSLKIPKDSKILVIGAYAPNIPFIKMNRRGYAVMILNRENIENSLSWNYDYIVIQKEFFSPDVYEHYPEIISKTSQVSDNGKLLICKLNKNEKEGNLDEYLGLNKITPVWEKIMNFEFLSSEEWRNISTSSEVSYSGNYAGLLAHDMEFGITFSSKDIDELRQKERTLYFQSHFFCNTVKNVKLVVNIRDGDENIYYKSANLQYFLKKPNSWEKADLVFNLPKVNNENFQFSLYLWNTDGASLFIDDFGFKLY